LSYSLPKIFLHPSHSQDVNKNTSELCWKILLKIYIIKGTPPRSGRVTHFKRFFSKTCFFLLLTFVGHSSLSCGTLKCLLLVGTSYKTCIIPVDLRKVLVLLFPVQQIHSNFKTSCQTVRYHKISFDKLNTLVTRKYRFSFFSFLRVLHDQTSVESL